MVSRAGVLIIVAVAAVAHAQEADYPAPPMVPAETPELTPPPQPAPEQQVPPPQPYPQQQQPYPQQQQPYPQQQQPYPQQQQPYPQQESQQPQFQRLPDYQQGQNSQVPYANAPLDPNRQPPGGKDDGSWISSTRSKHFLALLGGSVGVTSPGGLTLNLRLELDIARVAGVVSYTNFCWNSSESGCVTQVGQFNFLAGWAFASSDLFTFRVLGGLDLTVNGNLTAFSPVFGANLRSMLGEHFGFDAAALLTPGPFRQLEARGGMVFAYSLFEAHLGWRLQLMDATQSGNLGVLFSSAPAINGPYLAVALAL